MSDQGFLSRRAIARAERKLAPLLEPGERILEFDIFPMPGSGLFPGPAQRMDALLSDRAVYLVMPPEPLRIPLTEVRKVVVEGPLVAIRLWNDQTVMLGVPVGKPRPFTSMLQDKVPDRVLATIRLELTSDGKGGVTVTEEAGRPGSDSVHYDYVADDGVDLDSEPLRSLFEARMQQLIRERHPKSGDSLRRASE